MSILPLIVFDVNETLLDLQTMEPIFERIFGEKGVMRLWFANFILYSAASVRPILRRTAFRQAFRARPGRHPRRLYGSRVRSC
jgi:hypothetical protein